MSRYLLLLAALPITACRGDLPDAASQGMSIQEMSEVEKSAVLEVANTASFEELDVAAGLDRRAAENIVAHRDGADALLGTGDDDLFDSVDELDAVKWVGAATLAQLVAYAESLGLLVDAGPSPDDVTAILGVANTASLEALDVDAALDKRAAENIVAHRDGADMTPGTADDDPFDTLDELDAVAYVGDSALAKLLAYAQAQGPTTTAPCVIISEYIESAQNTDAIELYNCGATPVDQSKIGVCLVRNDDTTCTFTNMLTAGSLAAGEVWEVCRSATSVSWLPSIRIAENCRQEMPGIMNLSGDDRLLVFYDDDGDGQFVAGVDTALDAFGVIAERPPAEWWKNMDLRRCNLEPFDGLNSAEFYRWDYYAEYGDGKTEDYGVPPVGGGCP